MSTHYIAQGNSMSQYRKKSNLKDSIISLVVVLVILGGAVAAIINQYSEVDLSKKELEELRAEVKLEQVELLNKKDEWALKVEEDQDSIAIKREELKLEIGNFEAIKASFESGLEVEKEKFGEESIKEIERTVQAGFDLKIAQHKKYQEQLKSSVTLAEKKIVKLEEKNKSLKAQTAKYKKQLTSASKKLAVAKQQLAAKNKSATKSTSVAKTTTSSSTKSASNEVAKAKRDVAKLMDKLTKLNVDLKKPNWCDKAYTQRFNQANNILNAIKAMVKRYDLGDSYRAFISSNTRTAGDSDGWCNGVKVQ